MRSSYGKCKRELLGNKHPHLLKNQLCIYRMNEYVIPWEQVGIYPTVGPNLSKQRNLGHSIESKVASEINLGPSVDS